MSDLEKQIRRNRICEIYLLLIEAADKAAEPDTQAMSQTDTAPAKPKSRGRKRGSDER